MLELGLLAEAYVELDMTDHAERTLNDGLDLAEETSEGLYLPELYRLLGELSLAIDSTKSVGAEDHFRQALAVAARQGAYTLELRSARDLAELFISQGRNGEATTLLRPLLSRLSDRECE